MRFVSKSISISLFLSIFISGFAYAGDSIEDRHAAAERYLQVVPMSTMMNDAVAEFTKQVKPEKRAEFVYLMNQAIRANVLENVMKTTMVKVFTADEINALADFWGSKHGQAAMKKFGVYMGFVLPELDKELKRAFTQIGGATAFAVQSN